MPRVDITALGGRLRIATSRLLARMGLSDSAFLLVVAVLIGVVTAAAAVTFHELILWIRDVCYTRLGGADHLYARPLGLVLLALFPTLGGLAVGLIARYVIRAREGHGIVDVLEMVMRSRGTGVRPLVAVEKIVTAGITIGTGGSAGAEGPIVQIGASIASGVGRLFRVAHQATPLLIGCGSAAGISAIFNSPLGGVLFTLEVILQDFSIRTFTPVVLASVIANITVQAIFQRLHHEAEYRAIFAIPNWVRERTPFGWDQVSTVLLLGLICGVAAVVLTRAMYFAEESFHRLRFPRLLKPALGGAAVGLLGVGYIVLFGWSRGLPKPFAFADYPMPAFYGDGYGVIRRLLDGDFYAAGPLTPLLLLVGALIGLKIVATCLSLGSGGSGGIIAPSLFLGAATGSAVGMILHATGLFTSVQPEFYALLGMGAVLGAVVHAPLAGILILFDLTRDQKVMLPAMLTTVTATGFARVLFRDSIYTLSLRRRGVRLGGGVMGQLQRVTVEQVELEPAILVDVGEPLQKVLETVSVGGVTDIVATDKGKYAGMVTARDIQTALWQREAVPLLAVADLLRADVPAVRTTDDLATVLDTLTQYDVTRLPVTLPASPQTVIGFISRVGLLRRYQQAAG